MNKLPFAAADPLRVIPSIIAGSAAGAVTSMLLGAGNPAPWGGWIVLPVATGQFGYVIATVVGVTVTALVVNLLKKPVTEDAVVENNNSGNDDMELDISFE